MFHEKPGSVTSSRADRAHAEASSTAPAPPSSSASPTPSSRFPRRSGERVHWTRRYAAAVACPAAATALTLLLWEPVLSRNPFALFYAAVMLSAWYGGLGPGMVA